MPVCLTGDVHHQSLGTADQRVLDKAEPETAITYAKFVEDAGINATLFVTGRTADEHPDIVRRLGNFECIEVGGHNYGAFTIPGLPKSKLFFSGYRRFVDLNCPRWMQRRGIRKTNHKLKSINDEPVVSWRDHGFNADDNTYELLDSSGIQYVSDERHPDRLRPYPVPNLESLFEVPLNVPPDHDHIRHGTINPPSGWSDAFSGKIYAGEEWLSRVLSIVESIDAAGGLATVLAHPACMSIIDNFEQFNRLCNGLAEYETILMRNADKCV